MAKLWPPKDCPKVAARLILRQLVLILAIFFEIFPLNLLCPLLLFTIKIVGLKVAQSGFTAGKATMSHLEPLWKNKIKRLAY